MFGHHVYFHAGGSSLLARQFYEQALQRGLVKGHSVVHGTAITPSPTSENTQNKVPTLLTP